MPPCQPTLFALLLGRALVPLFLICASRSVLGVLVAPASLVARSSRHGRSVGVGWSGTHSPAGAARLGLAHWGLRGVGLDEITEHLAGSYGADAGPVHHYWEDHSGEDR